MQTAVASAKATAEQAKKTADEALAKAKEALAKPGTGGLSEAEAQAMIDKATQEIAEASKKFATLEQVDAKIAALKKELSVDFVTADALTALQTKVEALTAEVMNLIGHRLSSLSVIATDHVNGIAAITLTTLKYNPQRYYAPKGHHATDCVADDADLHAGNMPWLDHKANGKPSVYVSTDNNKAYFHVSPSMGVTNSDIEMPSFNCIKSQNQTRGKIATLNSPIQPVGYDIDGDQMEVRFKKTVTNYIGTDNDAHPAPSVENFYMASLKAPIAKKNWSPAEKAIENNEVAVNSEYVRLEELIKVPYLVNTKTNFSKHIDKFADETQLDVDGKPFYVHYHDSACVYNSEANEMVDVYQPYNKPLDLKKLVTVCVSDPAPAGKAWPSHVNHQDFSKEYKDYGLAFRFFVPSTPYITLGGDDENSNKTDQQKFAKLDSHENGILSSKVYDVADLSATAVGREPLVRVELRDTVNNNLVALRYIKIKWTKDAPKPQPEKELSVSYSDSIYVCGNYYGFIGTKQMNEDIYDKAKEGGMTKQEFHKIYTKFVDPEQPDGIAKPIINTEDGVESYNIVWILTHKDIVNKYPVWSKNEKMDFQKVVYWKSNNSAYPTLKITFNRSIYKPVFGHYGFDGRYWSKNNKYNIFNVNPIVYNTVENNPAWNDRTDHKNNPTCNIYTDLLNGFLDANGQMPMTGAHNVLYYTDTQKAPKTKVAYGKQYYEEGVQYVFDAEKLANGNNPEGAKYLYPYFNGTKIVNLPAEVRANGTELYINNELAATIENGVVNKCTNPANERKGAITYNIKLQETTPEAEPYKGADPTEAAKALIGQYVPVKLVADLCDDTKSHADKPLAHVQDIKAYDAFIIRPLTIGLGSTDNFTDATVDGSTIKVKGAFTYTCWNADASGKFYTASNSKGATALQVALWKFYECTPGQWMTTQATTNLKMDSKGNLVPTKGVTNGPLPSNTTVTYNADDETLTYYNHSGTPVNWDYEIYIPVKFGYKWQTMTQTFKVLVSKNAGTPSK